MKTFMKFIWHILCDIGNLARPTFEKCFFVGLVAGSLINMKVIHETAFTDGPHDSSYWSLLVMQGMGLFIMELMALIALGLAIVLLIRLYIVIEDYVRCKWKLASDDNE